MICLRPLVFLSLCLLLAEHAFAGAVRIEGIPSRNKILLQQVITPSEPIAKLPPPVAPGIDGSFSAVVKEAPATNDVSSKAATAKPPAVIVSPTEARKNRIDADRARLDKNALRFQESRAEQGSPSAIRSLGMRYIRADGVERDISKGLDLLRKAAAAGDTIAQAELSKLEPARKE